MPITGEIQSLYKDKDKTKLIFPTTKVKAISDDDGVGLNVLLEHMVYSDPEDMEIAATPINADVLGGFPASDYATKTYVSNKIAEVQLEGSDVDLSGYVTKDELTSTINNIDYPVDSVNGKTGAVNLSAADVGARPNTWTPTAADVGARPSSWLPTIAEIGAAPDGHGLGTAAVDKAWSDVDSLVTNGWYRFQNINVTLNNVGVVSALLKVSFFGGMYGEQVLYAINTASGSSEIPVLRRTRGYGAWQPWECVNPPMNYGVEYRTIERFGGKVVYCKVVSTGAYPGAGGFKIVSTGTTAMTRVIRHCGFVNTGTYVVSLPIFDETNGAETGYHIVTSERNIYLVSKGNASIYTSSCVYMWYTKD